MSGNNNVAIVFDDMTEFFVMRPAIDSMQKNNIPVDIIVPYDSGYNDLAKHTFDKIESSGYKPLKDVNKTKEYQILLVPYPYLGVVKRAKYNYLIRYPYGAVSAKPDPVYRPELKIELDVSLFFNRYETQFLDAYGTTCYSLPYWRYYNFKHNKHTGKLNLLLLPTFGNASCIDDIDVNAVTKIKEKYHVITKAHHAVHFRSEEKTRLEKLKSIADEFYDSDISIDELLAKSDVVLSDNSGAIFEAIAASVPIAVFTKNPNICHLGNISTYHSALIKDGIIPYTNIANNIIDVVDDAIGKYYKKQQALRDIIFVSSKGDPLNDFIEVIKSYLTRDVKSDYKKQLHDLMLEERKGFLDKILTLQNENNKLQNELSGVRDELSSVYLSRSWKITKPLRNLRFKIGGK